MTQRCDHCNKCFNKTEVRVKCDFCDVYFHQECATQLNPSLTKTALDTIMLNSKLDNLEKYMREITTQLMEIKKDLSHSVNRNENFEKIINTKINKLEEENNGLRRQMNRADIIITGLPQTIPNEKLYSTVIDLAKALGLEITTSDLYLCSWIGKKSSVLVKFNSVLTRDSLMINYRANYDLKLNQIMSTENVQSRVYINAHHTPLVSKFRYYCR
ncbi:hypothetical protein FF38_00082 [Lucilia cuprina]|uniref:Phorbol-ester/DAG-type domain-containing protein n=1 Tax=Lucilia cuprina TaxID=7375 RepID=A0A0L0BLD9_LUCCU|nr:hypothetical protein FF38_00082 [Lucilia cuprina]